MTRRCRLAEVTIASTGTHNPTAQPEAEFTYVDVAAVDNYRKVIAGAKVMRGADAPSRARKVLRSGDVIVSTVRPNLNAVALVTENLDGQIGSTGFCVLRAKRDCVLPEYLFYFSRSKAFVDGLVGLVSGALYPAVTDRQVLDQVLPIPPLGEQRRIVDLLSRAEGIVRLRREAQAKSAAIVPALFVDMFGDPATNPKKWEMRSLANVLIETKLGLVRGAKEMGEDKAYPYLRMDAVSGGTIRLHGLKRVDASPKDVRDFSLRAGDFLFNTRNSRELVGKTGLVNVTPLEPTIFNNNLMRMRFSEDVLLPEFVNSQFQTSHVQRQLEAIKRGTTTVFAIYYKDLKDVSLVVPALELQREFSDRVCQLTSILSLQQTALKRAEATFHSLLGGFFTGSQSRELVATTEEMTVA